MQANAGRMCFTNPHAFDSRIPALKFRKYDAVISEWTYGRSKQVAFGNLLCELRSGDCQKDTYKATADLKGKRIGMENGTSKISRG